MWRNTSIELFLKLLKLYQRFCIGGVYWDLQKIVHTFSNSAHALQIRNKRTKKCTIVRREACNNQSVKERAATRTNRFILQSLLIRKVIVTCGIDYSKRHLSKSSHHTETSQLICNTNQTTGFSMIRIFTERSFWIGFRRYYWE